MAHGLHAHHLAAGPLHTCKFGQRRLEIDVMQRAIFDCKIKGIRLERHVFAVHDLELAMFFDTEPLGIGARVFHALRGDVDTDNIRSNGSGIDSVFSATTGKIQRLDVTLQCASGQSCLYFSLATVTA